MSIVCILCRRVAVASVILPIAACGATASYVATAPARAPRPVESVGLMFGRPPANCAYREVGYVEGQSNADVPANAINAMRAEAARRGDDAIVIIDHQDASGHHEAASHNFAAVAIEFVGTPCSGTGLLAGPSAPVYSQIPPASPSTVP